MRKAIYSLFFLLLLLCTGCTETEAPVSEAGNAEAVATLPAPAPQEKTLTVARMENNRFVSEVLTQFNAQQSGFQAESVWYYDREGELKLQLAAGDGPGLMSLEFLDYEIYAAKGVFEDLYSYIDADPDLSRSDLVEPVLHTLEWHDGVLYQIAPSFDLSCMFTCPDTVDPALPWNLDTVEQWMTEHPEARFTGDAESAADILSLLLTGYLPQLVDYETMTCDFTSGLFSRLLTDAKSWAERPWKYGEMDSAVYSSGALLGGWYYLRDFATYQEVLNLGLTTPSGFPSDTDSGVYVSSVTRFAICKGTGQENLAWEFLKTSLSPELQQEAPWLPLLKSELNRRARNAQKESPPTVTEIYQNPEAAAQGTNTGTVTVTLPPAAGMSADTAEQMLGLLDRVSGCRGNSDVNILSIIYEESDACFANGKSSEETAKNVQSRVSLYLSERA